MKMLAAVVVLAVVMSAGAFAEGQAGYTSSQSSGMMPAPGAGSGPMAGGGMMGMMQGAGTTITVDGRFIYIVRGNELLKLDKQTLQLLAQTTLPPPMVPGGMGAGPGAAGRGPAADMQMHPEMQQMMNQMRSLTPLQFDQSFLQNMIRHNSAAIAMSRLAVQKAQHTELRQFAQRVIDDLSAQNRQFSVWLTNWYGVSIRPDLMPAAQIMVNRLQGLSGQEFEMEYMRHMIMHLSGSVSMAQMAQQKASHPELIQAASNIVTEESAKVNQLRIWLSSWYGG